MARSLDSFWRLCYGLEINLLTILFLNQKVRNNSRFLMVNTTRIEKDSKVVKKIQNSSITSYFKRSHPGRPRKLGVVAEPDKLNSPALGSRVIRQRNRFGYVHNQSRKVVMDGQGTIEGLQSSSSTSYRLRSRKVVSTSGQESRITKGPQKQSVYRVDSDEDDNIGGAGGDEDNSDFEMSEESDLFGLMDGA